MKTTIKRLMTALLLLISVEGFGQYQFDTIPSPNNTITLSYNGYAQWSNTVFWDYAGNILVYHIDSTKSQSYIEKYTNSTWYRMDSADTNPPLFALGGAGYPILWLDGSALPYPVDKNNNVWGLTDSTLIKVTDTDSSLFRIPYYINQYPCRIQNACLDDSNNIWLLMQIADANHPSLDSQGYGDIPSLAYLVKFDGVNWTKYHLVDYDTSGLLVLGCGFLRNYISQMYFNNGKVYILSLDASSGGNISFDGYYLTFVNYLATPMNMIQPWFLGKTKQDITLVSVGDGWISGGGFQAIEEYDSNDNLLQIDTVPIGFASYTFIDNKNTIWTTSNNYDTIIYYNPFSKISGRIVVPSYLNLETDSLMPGKFYLSSFTINSAGNKLLLASSDTAGEINSLPNTRMVTFNLDTFYMYLFPTSDSVWPGDADANHVVDNNDLLPIGLGYDSTGPARQVQGIIWQGDSATGWTNSFTSYTPAVNYNNADCNGDGIINADDTLAITVNFGDTHAKTNGMPGLWRSGIPALYAKLSEDTLYAGDTLTVTFILGDSSLPVNDFYGIAFTYNFDPLVVDSTYTGMTYGNSWIGNTTDKISISKIFAAGQIKTAVTRINHIVVSGSGAIGTVSFKITTDNISGKTMSYYPNIGYISDIRAIDQMGNSIPLNAATDTSSIGFTPSGIAEISTEGIHIQPNPAHDKITVSAGNIMDEITITDVAGQIVMDNTPAGGKSAVIDISAFGDGLYIVQVKTDKGVGIAKLIVEK